MKKILPFLLVLLSLVSFGQTNSIYKGSASVNADSAVFRNIVNNLQSTYGDIGALYYNRESSKWRIFADSIWRDLVVPDSLGNILIAYNGLTLSNDSISLGGALTESTTISGAQTLTFSNDTTTFSGTTLNHTGTTLNTNPTTWNIQRAPTITAGQKFTFSPSATLAGINVGSLSGNPSVPSVGDLYYDTSAGNIKFNNATGNGRNIMNALGLSATSVPFAINGTGGCNGDSGFTFSTTNDVLTVGSLTALTTTTTPALNIGSFAGNPSSLSNGSVWQNSSTNSINFRINSTTVQHFNNGFTFGATPFVLSTSGSNETFTIGASNFNATISATENITFDGETFILDYGTPSLTFSNAVANQFLVAPTTGNDLILSGGGGSGDDTQIGVSSSAGSVILETSTNSTGQLKINDGSNETMGLAVLIGGTVTVNNVKVTANSRIFLTSQVDGGTPGFVRVSARSAGNSFTITSSSGTDTSSIAWLIIEPN